MFSVVRVRLRHCSCCCYCCCKGMRESALSLRCSRRFGCVSAVDISATHPIAGSALACILFLRVVCCECVSSHPPPVTHNVRVLSCVILCFLQSFGVLFSSCSRPGVFFASACHIVYTFFVNTRVRLVLRRSAVCWGMALSCCSRMFCVGMVLCLACQQGR